MSSYRDRRREAVVREIKETALRRLEVDGADGLALRAVARDMGLRVQSLYHYFAGRDELITSLMIDAHNGLADALEQARDALPEHAVRQRRIATAMAYRRWAVEHRAEFQLIYGTPVAGYRPEPLDGDGTTGNEVPPAARIGAVFRTVTFAGWTAEQLAAVPGEHLGPTLRKQLASSEQPYATGQEKLPPAALHRFVQSWARLHGMITLELFGHLDWLATDGERSYRAVAEQLADELAEVAAETAVGGARDRDRRR